MSHTDQTKETVLDKAFVYKFPVAELMGGEPKGSSSLSKVEQLTNSNEGGTEGPIRHPLHNTWTLWYLEVDRTKAWEDQQNEVMSFNTVEDFWSLYNHIKPPSEIKMGSDYSLFKRGIRPMWEDPLNNRGGRWIIILNKNLNVNLDNVWLDVLLCLIGEAFEYSDNVCGAVVNLRSKAHKISVWTVDGSDQAAVMEIGHKLRAILHLGHHALHYYLHQDAMDKPGPNQKPVYSL